ncbi:DUF4179 domain-containing protein [Sporosarcina sp. FSL W7-1349]|uniref:DUF4179 domain-containing protein n=1 Tax=Sporosarcina sp. FSL W7-1349 TaxID=2921561 RepID=UPI0030F9A240
MIDFEKRFHEEAKRLKAIPAPEELEGRLRNALDSVPVRKRNRVPRWVMAAAALFFLSAIGYHYNAFAYYGKKIFGFDELMSSTLSQLNDEGMGQEIGKKIELKDGTEFVVEGVMSDANQLLLYYTILNSSEGEDIQFPKITGLFTDSMFSAGTSIFNEKTNELKGQLSFDPVNPFAKTLTLEFTKPTEGNDMIEAQISFPYNPNDAMQTSIQQRINKTLQVDQGTITFKTIKATPMTTVIEGKLDVKNFDRINLPLYGVELRANGHPVELQGTGSSSSLVGRKFELQYDTLPENIETLELVVKDFVGYAKVDASILLQPSGMEPVEIAGKLLSVRNVEQTADGLEITIATDEDVMLDGVTVEGEGVTANLMTTVRQVYEEQEDGSQVKVRTMVFDRPVIPETMLIQGIHYRKAYGDIIVIPVK